jgi:hypothetical protein
MLIGAAALSLASLAWAGIPDPIESYAVAQSEPNQVSCVICPAGDTTTLTACYLFGGTPTVSAVIDLWVRDINGDPVYLYPPDDLWVVFNGQCDCPVHACVADAPTDANGHTTFSGPWYGAGCSNDNSTNISLNGLVLIHPGMPIWFNSPDMNCDLVVNLTDVVLFAASYGTGAYCADFLWDGIVNLSDIVLLAQHYGHTCP